MAAASETSGVHRAYALAPAALTLLAALYSLFVVCRADHVTATTAQWLGAAAKVREGRKPSELIVFAPAWIDPLGRQYLGDQMTIDMAARMDSARYSGIWEVSLDDAPAPEVAGLVAQSSAAFGPLRVRHYAQTPAKVRFDFTREWRAGEASGAMQGRPSLSLQEVGFAPHRCIKVVPRPGQTATLRFDAVPLGSQIVGYVGLADVFTRRDVRDPGRLEMLVNDVVVATVMAGIDDGWQRFSAATKPGLATVEFRLTAVGAGARDRRICFAAEARE